MNAKPIGRSKTPQWGRRLFGLCGSFFCGGFVPSFRIVSTSLRNFWVPRFSCPESHHVVIARDAHIPIKHHFSWIVAAWIWMTEPFIRMRSLADDWRKRLRWLLPYCGRNDRRRYDCGCESRKPTFCAAQSAAHSVVHTVLWRRITTIRIPIAVGSHFGCLESLVEAKVNEYRTVRLSL